MGPHGIILAAQDSTGRRVIPFIERDLPGPVEIRAFGGVRTHVVLSLFGPGLCGL
jgi:hypothetical protein